jgi:flagellar hook-basal body complex protein FliE
MITQGLSRTSAMVGGAELPAPAAKAVTPGPGGDFASVLAGFATDTVETLKAAEATATAGVAGRASVQQVVEAVMGAEQQLQAAIAIRDKVVSAYLEISRMAI